METVTMICTGDSRRNFEGKEKETRVKDLLIESGAEWQRTQKGKHLLSEL